MNSRVKAVARLENEAISPEDLSFEPVSKIFIVKLVSAFI